MCHHVQRYALAGGLFLGCYGPNLCLVGPLGYAVTDHIDEPGSGRAVAGGQRRLVVAEYPQEHFIHALRRTRCRFLWRIHEGRQRCYAPLNLGIVS